MAPTSRPGPHPEPPLDLHTRKLPLIRLATSWQGIHRCAFDPLYFGMSGDNRFDARHDPSRFVVALYDRAAGAVRVEPGASLLDPRHTTALADMLDTYHFGLI